MQSPSLTRHVADPERQYVWETNNNGAPFVGRIAGSTISNLPKNVFEDAAGVTCKPGAGMPCHRMEERYPNDDCVSTRLLAGTILSER